MKSRLLHDPEIKIVEAKNDFEAIKNIVNRFIRYENADHAHLSAVGVF